MLQVFDSDLVPIALALTGALLCLASGFRELRAGEREREVAAWWTFALVLLAVATGHLWNLGGGVAESGRDAFRFEGLYGARRPFQAGLVIALLAGAALASPFILRWVHAHLGSRFLLPVVVLGGLVGFLAVRTISLHAIDAVLYGKHILGGHPGAILEALGLLAFVLAAAAAAMAESSHRQTTSSTPGPNGASSSAARG